MAVSQDVRRELATTGAAVTPVWGGPRKQLYYTPSGEEVWGIPSLRDWVRKNDEGKVIEQGTRDANLDKGWSLSRPADLKLHCVGCDHWHDTPEDVEACVEAKRAVAATWEKKAAQMMGGDTDGSTTARLDDLEQSMARIEGLLLKLTEG